MKILLDTDILLDLALNRSPHAIPAAQLLEALEAGWGKGFLAWHSLSNFYYLVAPVKGSYPARDFLKDLIRFIQVAPTTTESFLSACQFQMKDFEDAMQVAAALACGAEVIATRNIRDYAKAPILAATPSTILKEWKRSFQ